MNEYFYEVWRKYERSGYSSVAQHDWEIADSSTVFANSGGQALALARAKHQGDYPPHEYQFAIRNLQKL